jgi:hypothetical protein
MKRHCERCKVLLWKAGMAFGLDERSYCQRCWWLGTAFLSVCAMAGVVLCIVVAML